MAVDIRFLGQSCFELKAGGATVLTDPFLTGNPKAAASADEVEAGRDPAHPRPRRPPRRHGRHRQAHRRDGGRDRRAGRRDRRRRASRTSSTRTSAAPSQFDWGWVKLVPAWHTAVSPSGTPHMPAGLLIHIGDRLVYHLGDTCLFSDMQLIARRGDKVDLALVPIGGHYTMDRFDAVTAVRVHQPAAGHPLPLQHVPADRDRRRGLQVRRPERGLLAGRRARAGRDPHGQVTHAIVLIEAERSAIEQLGGALADVEGVAEAYSVTGEWDFVAMLRVRDAAGGGRGRHPALRGAGGHQAHAHAGRLRGLLPARPRGAVLDRELSAAASLRRAARRRGPRRAAATTRRRRRRRPRRRRRRWRPRTPTPTPTATETPTADAPPSSPAPEEQEGGAGDEEAARGAGALHGRLRRASTRRRSRCPRSWPSS